MGDEEGSRDLPQRSRGAARGGSDRSAPVLSEEIRQRIQAAVRAERAGTVAQDNQLTTKLASPPRAAPADPAPAQPQPPEPPQPEPSFRQPAKIRLIASALILVLVATGALITVVSLHKANSSRGNSGPSPAVLRQEEAVTRGQAASWVTSQLNPDSTVACDPVMCQALRAERYPAGKLVTLGPQSPFPVTSAVVVVTEAVRELFGTSIGSAFAPAVLTSMGTGAAEVTVRLITPHGALAYQNQLTAGMAARATYGQTLLQIDRIQLSGPAEQQLASGQVDARLVVAIASLGGAEPISILGFGNVGSGASAGVPLRYADLATTDSAANQAGPAYLRAMQALISQLPSQYRPTSSQTVGHVFRVAFTAPSPLGAISAP
jgi:hypothetical protein